MTVREGLESTPYNMDLCSPGSISTTSCASLILSTGLRGKQLLLGANGSGKSSLLTAIRYLKWFIKDDENRFTQSTRTRWLDLPLQVFEIQASLEGQTYEYRVEIRFAPDTRQPSVNLERLKVSDTPVFELANGEIHFFPNNSGQATKVPLETTKSALHLAQLSKSYVRRFVEWMETVHCFHIDAYPEAMDESADREDREPDDELENLAGLVSLSSPSSSR
jgi:predicted ATPase